MFQAAQWAAGSGAAASMAQMAARGAAGDAGLAALVRERQDLVAEWQKRDALRNKALALKAEDRNAQAEEENSARLEAIDTRIKEIGKRLAAEFPDYASLASGTPLSVADVQSALGANEALVFFLDTPELKPAPEETFVWVVTKRAMRWLRSPLGSAALAREVQALRCGLDAVAWEGGTCASLTGQTYSDADREAGNPLPFDYARAYKLYRALFGEAEDLIAGKSLLLVPSGPLTQLPFQVLITADPGGSDDRSAAWLIRSHALSVLPAVSSLKALRRVARPSAARKPMIGFGNPLLDGDQNDARFGAYFKAAAQRARDSQSCAAPRAEVRMAMASAPRGVVRLRALRGLADGKLLRLQDPLPETADELCAVARDLEADANDIHLGARATEAEVKQLSASGELARYRFVHFATHGALAGELDRNSEPGLLLTPPAEASEEDDGYLTASEIAGLKLDADWVVLSACNTAGAGTQGAEALSGLARAFIYAQARALLVSHWAVNSGATVSLVTGAMRRLAADTSIGRAEAMRQSMLDLIDKGEPQQAGPAFWAPFAVVGEGAAPASR
jgi:CHAT domain-containing protein